MDLNARIVFIKVLRIIHVQSHKSTNANIFVIFSVTTYRLVYNSGVRYVVDIE